MARGVLKRTDGNHVILPLKILPWFAFLLRQLKCISLTWKTLYDPALTRYCSCSVTSHHIHASSLKTLTLLQFLQSTRLPPTLRPLSGLFSLPNTPSSLCTIQLLLYPTLQEYLVFLENSLCPSLLPLWAELAVLHLYLFSVSLSLCASLDHISDTCSVYFIYIYYFNFLAMAHSMWDLTSLTRDWIHTLCLEEQCLNHWPAREVPHCSFSYLLPSPLLESHCPSTGPGSDYYWVFKC